MFARLSKCSQCLYAFFNHMHFIIITKVSYNEDVLSFCLKALVRHLMDSLKKWQEKILFLHCSGKKICCLWKLKLKLFLNVFCLSVYIEQKNLSFSWLVTLLVNQRQFVAVFEINLSHLCLIYFNIVHTYIHIKSLCCMFKAIAVFWELKTFFSIHLFIPNNSDIYFTKVTIT